MALPDQPPSTDPEWNRWRGSVDTTLKQVDTRLGAVEGEVKETNKTLSNMPKEIAKVIKNGQANNPAPSDGQPVTIKWITEKILLPIVILVAAAIVAAAMGGM